MVGVLIATHGTLAAGLVDSVELIMGRQTHLETMSLLHETNIEAFGEEMAHAIRRLDHGKGVLVFVDLFAASPYNQAVFQKKNLTDVNYRIISGVNLSMVLECLGLRSSGDSIDDIWENVLNAGKEGIKEFHTELANYVK